MTSITGLRSRLLNHFCAHTRIHIHTQINIRTHNSGPCRTRWSRMWRRPSAYTRSSCGGCALWRGHGAACNDMRGLVSTDVCLHGMKTDFMPLRCAAGSHAVSQYAQRTEGPRNRQGADRVRRLQDQLHTGGFRCARVCMHARTRHESACRQTRSLATCCTCTLPCHHCTPSLARTIMRTRPCMLSATHSRTCTHTPFHRAPGAVPQPLPAEFLLRSGGPCTTNREDPLPRLRAVLVMPTQMAASR